MKKRNFDIDDVTVNQSMSVPAFRMMFVQVGIIELDEHGQKINERFHTVHPVLAIISKTKQVYSTPSHYGRIEIDSMDGGDGWQKCGVEEEIDAVVYDESEFGIECTSRIKKWGAEDQKRGFVVLPWPHDESKDQAAIQLKVNQLFSELEHENKLKKAKANP